MSNIGKLHEARGLVIGIGGTNARTCLAEDGEIIGARIVPTLDDPKGFFGWTARQILQAAHGGAEWAVVGVPGPVSPDGTRIGPMENISGLRDGSFDLARELHAADPDVQSLLDAGFPIVGINDAALAAHAAAQMNGVEQRHRKIAAVIIGTGVGAGLVFRDPFRPNVFRTDEDPLEIGHVFWHGIGGTYEEEIAGPALKDRHLLGPENLPVGHPAWRLVAGGLASIIHTLGMIKGADLVVPCGGVGGGASPKYAGELRKYLEQIARRANPTQTELMPETMTIDPKEVDFFELNGGASVIRSHTTQIVKSHQSIMTKANFVR